MTTHTTTDEETYQTHTTRAAALTNAIQSRQLNNNPAIALQLAQVHATLALAAAVHGLDATYMAANNIHQSQ